MLKCQVFAYESETFHRRRPNGISHCQNEDKNSKASPSPCTKAARRNSIFWFCGLRIWAADKSNAVSFRVAVARHVNAD